MHIFQPMLPFIDGPDFKEYYLKRAKEEYCNGNIPKSILYQINALCIVFQTRYKVFFGQASSAYKPAHLIELSDEEKKNVSQNALLQYGVKITQEKNELSTCKKSENPAAVTDDFSDLSNIFQGVEYEKLIELLCLLPKEWTVIQLFKEYVSSTTYSTFLQINQKSAPIYVVLLKHCRSDRYPEPICIRISNSNMEQMYTIFSQMSNNFKNYTTFHGNDQKNNEQKGEYWKGLSILEKIIQNAIDELVKFVGPWRFLFSGSLQWNSESKQEEIISKVDDFCDKHRWEPKERVLLSLGAMQTKCMSEEEIQQLSEVLALDQEEIKIVNGFLTSMKVLLTNCELHYYPCITILDERLDHFFWEKLNPKRSICRVSSLQMLFYLYKKYRKDIHKGYLVVNVADGACIVNPDKNLNNMEERMKLFFNYWTPKWNLIISKTPTLEEFKQTFNSDCYIYCGHGSGLQHISGKEVAKIHMRCIVFLFGCDSVRLKSNGLYSEMVGSHLYYHAALCPAVVGTTMPGLDFPMDCISSKIISEWIPPNDKKVLHWNCVDKPEWKKNKIIKPIVKEEDKQSTSTAASNKTSENKLNIKCLTHFNTFYDGDLTTVVNRVHQDKSKELYNTIGFIYRGLPVWNSNVQHIPS